MATVSGKLVGLTGRRKIDRAKSEDTTLLILSPDPSPANGVTLCTGSLGARPDNDLPGMMQRLGARVHFLHLRNVKRESSDIRGSFYEAEHLGGDTDMVAVIAAALREERRRVAEGRAIVRATSRSRRKPMATDKMLAKKDGAVGRMIFNNP